MRKYAVAFFSVFLAISSPAVANSDLNPGNNQECNGQLQPPPWPLPPLDKDERAARLEFFLEHQEFHFTDTKGEITEKECLRLLETLSQPSQREILEPAIVAKTRDDKSIAGVIANCPDMQFDRLWFSTEIPLIPNINPDFAKLSIQERDAYADYVSRFQANFEFYDLSQYMNAPVWGTFAEGGVMGCKDPQHEICRKLEGYRLYGGIIGMVFDAKTCDVYLGPRLRANRRFTVNTRRPYAYNETPSFFAFVEMEGKPYRLAVNSYVPWSDFHALTEAGVADLSIDAVTLDAGGTCLFSSMD